MAGRDFDSRLADELSDDLEALAAELRKAMTGTVKVRIADQPCEKCGCKHVRYVEVPDFRTKLDIAEWAANRGFGRPAQSAGEEGGERIVFQRLVSLPADEE